MSRIRICVVIGLQQNLDDVLQEAKEVAAAAKESGLFDKVYELIGQEATAENIRSKLSDAVRDLRDNSLLVVFYAGHGYFESGFTWIKTAEAPIALQKEVFEHVKQLRQNDGTTRRNSLDFGFVFSCCRIADPDGLQQDRDTSPPDYKDLAGDTIIELHACQPGSCVVDSVLLGFALAYYLRKKPADFESMLQSVSTDVRYLSIDRIQPYTKKVESNHTIVLHSGKTDSQNPIMGEAELRHFKDAFLLSNHIFEAIQQEMKAADPMRSYENVRGELAEMARLIAGMGKQVTNLQIQLSVLCQWPLSEMNATLEIWMREPQLSEYLAACDRDIQNWQLIPSTPREAFYSALRKVSSGGLRDLHSPAMCARVKCVKKFLGLFVSSISVLFPGEVEESSEQSSDVDGCSHDPEVHQTHLRIPDADAADFSERERAAVLDALYDMLNDMGIGNDAAFSILSGSLWIVISTSAPLADKQRSGLVAALNMYVKKCKSGKNGPTSACAWMFAKTVQLTNGALVPISVFNRVRLARDLQKKLQKRPTADASWSTWLDANGIKAIATAVYNSNEGRSVISERQVRLFHHGQELQGRELLRSAGDIQITVEKMWEELTWSAALEETMQKISQRQDAKEMPWARSKSFQDFALAVFGICSSPDAVLSQLCIQGLQDVLQSDKFMDSCTNPLALLTEVLSYLLANDPDMAEPIEPMKEMPEMPPATQDPLEDDMAESKEELPPIRNPLEALECPALKELHAQLASFPLTQDSLLKAVIAFPSMIHLPIFPDFLNVLEALTRPVTTRGPSGGSSLQDEVDQEVAVMLKALPANIERLGCENALADFIAEWR